MVPAALSIGGVIGVLLSAGFVYAEVGRYATPQVPQTLFDERKEIFAYTAGLFVGVPLALPFLFYIESLSNAALPGALIFLVILVGGTELAQRLLLRTRYFGTGESGPFYALGFRAGISGILVLALVAQTLGAALPAASRLGLLGLQAVTLVALEVAGALLSIRTAPVGGVPAGGAFSGALVEGVGFFLLGFGAFFDLVTGLIGTVVALIGALLVYQRLRPMLSRIPPPTTLPRRVEPAPESRFGRTRP